MTTRSSPERRMIFVANAACGKPTLCAELTAHAGAESEVLVVAPMIGSTLDRWTSDDAEDRRAAEARLRRSVKCLRRHGLDARGVVGDADPLQAIEDALYRFAADEIVICLEEHERERWLRPGLVARARRRFDVPIVELDIRSTAAVA